MVHRKGARRPGGTDDLGPGTGGRRRAYRALGSPEPRDMGINFPARLAHHASIGGKAAHMDHRAHRPGTVDGCKECLGVAYEPSWYASLAAFHHTDRVRLEDLDVAVRA